MATEPGHEPISDDERIFRRIPVSRRWYSDDGLSPEAYEPRDDEETGISVYREKYKPLHEAAKGKSKQGYYVAVIKAGELRQNGIRITPRPQPGDPGHAELPDFTCRTRDEDSTIQLRNTLATLHESVQGPFLSSDPPA